MRRSVALCLFGLVAGTTRAEQWAATSEGQERHESDPTGPQGASLFFIMTTIFDCKKKASRVEAGEAHLADGTVKQWQRSNPQEFWLRTDDDVALAFVCAWPGPNGQGSVQKKPDD